MDPLLEIFNQRPKANWEWNFNPGVTDWNPANALALANCALLAYADLDRGADFHEVEHQLLSRGFTQVVPCVSKNSDFDTQCYVAVRPELVVVAFRGTRPTSMVDWATDLLADQIPFDSRFRFPGWGSVHEGFVNGLAEVTQDLSAALAKFDDARHSLWITGHSLGGGLAMLAAALISNLPGHPIDGVYTFGQPRVGDKTFCNQYDNRDDDGKLLKAVSFRVVNNRDLVPHVPPKELSIVDHLGISGHAPTFGQLADAIMHLGDPAESYAHAGQLRLLRPRADGTVDVSHDSNEEDKMEPDFLTARQPLSRVVSILSQPPGDLLPRLADHFPIGLDDNGYIDRLQKL